MPVKGENAMDENRIRQRAYEIWEQEGRPEGRHAEHWEQACRECERDDASNLGRAARDMGNIESGERRGAEERAPGAREEAGGGA